MNLKLRFTEDIIELIKIYNRYSYEVGGIVFGNKFFNHYFVKTMSFKKGKKIRIDFDGSDVKIYNIPNGMRILGTWHLHPMQKQASPSIIDLLQWKQWKREYIHIICTKNDFKVFNGVGEVLYEHILG